jgi:hypothetical protein
MILPATLLYILDGYHLAYKTADLNASSARITANDIHIVGGDGVSSMVYGSGDRAFIKSVADVNSAFAAAILPDAVFGKAQAFFSALDSYFAANTAYVNLDAYATAQNTATPLSFLVAPNAAYLRLIGSGGRSGGLMTEKNVFPPTTHLGSGTISGIGAVTFTAGSTIPTANTAGPPAIQGYAPAKGGNVTITTAIVGTITIRVTANGWDSTGAPVTGRFWTAVISNDGLGVVVPLVPANAGDRISQITACGTTGTNTATAGAFSLESAPERVIV